MIYSRDDGTYVIEHNNMPYHVVPEDPLYQEVQERIEKGEEVKPEKPFHPSPEHEYDDATNSWFLPKEAVERRMRERRARLIAETDYLMLPDYPLENRREWEAYRQALRDITKQEGFPEDIQWPEKPVMEGNNEQ